MLLLQHWKCPCVYVAPGVKADQPCMGFTLSELTWITRLSSAVWVQGRVRRCGAAAAQCRALEAQCSSGASAAPHSPPHPAATLRPAHPLPTCLAPLQAVT